MRTILVVDDDLVSIRLIEMIAGRNGYTTVGASSADEAIAWLDGSPSVEMVITDQHMAGKSGLELYSVVHADLRFRHVPFILCTGLADRATIEEAMKLGIRHFIVKPITPRVVTEKVATVEAERPRVMETREAAMARLQLTDREYKSLVVQSRQQLLDLRKELATAYKSGDRVTASLVTPRFREPAELLDASRLIAAVDAMANTRTWHDTEEALALIFLEVGALVSALDVESGPRPSER